MAPKMHYIGPMWSDATHLSNSSRFFSGKRNGFISSTRPILTHTPREKKSSFPPGLLHKSSI